jgi:hypothetical protein
MQEKSEKTRIDSFLVAIIFLIFGITLLALSVFSSSQIVSIIGLGLTFWGALFLLIPPPKHIEASFLITSTLPDYMTIDRMLTYLNPENEAYNIPPCPRDVVLPEHLEGLKDMVTFIPAGLTEGMAEIEDIARGHFFIEEPKGLLITSPGIALLDRIEQKGKIDFSKIPFDELDETLPHLLSGLYLSQEIKLTTSESDLTLQVDGSLYKNLYSEKYNLKSINLLGCPLVNATACAIAKSIGKPTMIQEIKTTPNGKTTTATFRIVNRKFEKLQKLTEGFDKVSLRTNELVDVIDASIGIVDLSFNILIGLQKKHINWQLLEEVSKGFGDTFSFVGQSIPPLNLGFETISLAIKRQIPADISEEAYNVLKVIYSYFDSLSFDDDLPESVPNFPGAKAIILSYYTLNDLLLGRVVGDKENKKEPPQLEKLLQTLAEGTVFKVNFRELMDSIELVKLEDDLMQKIDDCRMIFKEQLMPINPIFSRLVSKRKL